MKKLNILLSIVIPSRNREYYAAQTISLMARNILDLNIEFILYNNSDKDLYSKYFSSIKDSRFKYFYNGDKLSVVDDFNLALSKATGEYVCIIGDDDWVRPEIILFIKLMKKMNIDCLKPIISIGYNWSSSHKIFSNKFKPNLLTIKEFNSKIKKIDTRNGLINLLKNGGQNYNLINVAKLYHGVVKLSAIKNLIAKYGNIFGGVSPDIYSSTILSVDNNLISYTVDFPIIISGVCNKSTSSDSSSGKHVGSLKSVPHLNGIDSYYWEPMLKYFYSVENVWADSLFKAMKSVNQLDLFYKYFNFKFYLFFLKLNNLKYIRENNITLPISFFNNLLFQIFYIKIKLLRYISRFFRLLKRLLFKTKVYKNVDNVEFANELINYHLKIPR